MLPTMPNRSLTGKSRGYAGSLPWLTVAKPGVTLSPPWTQLMPVCYGFARWSYGRDTVHAGRATVMPRNKPVLFRSPVRPDESWRLQKLKPPGPHPGKSRFNTIYPDSMRCLPASLRCGLGGSRCPHRSDAGTKIWDSVTRLYGRVILILHIQCLFLNVEINIWWKQQQHF